MTGAGPREGVEPVNASPLGKYGELAATAIALGLVFAALIAHLFPVLSGGNTTWLDNAALLVLGVVLGQRQTTNGAAKIAEAAHKRLDLISAPPADGGAPPA